MKVKTKTTFKILAALLLSVYFYSFAHVIKMGVESRSNNCPHQESNHQLCLVTQSLKDAVFVVGQKIFTILLTVIIPTSSTLFLIYIIQILIPRGIQNNSPPLLQELFSNGILNPKAP